MHMKAFRGYFDFEDNLKEMDESSARIGMSFDDDENTTGVKHVQTSKEEAVYYNLNGQRVEKQAKGLYITVSVTSISMMRKNCRNNSRKSLRFLNCILEVYRTYP